jgi:cytochrome b subunit of formate dehydrogenase
MTGLLIGTFAFFGLHTLFWLVRAVYLFCTTRRSSARPRSRRRTDDEWFTRFVPFERFLHFLVVTSFLLLVITGMPLKFYYTDWAKAIFASSAAPETARTLHRFGAIVTFLYFGCTSVARRPVVEGRGNLRNPETASSSLKRLWRVLFGPDSMVPTLQDWRDFVAHNKWFFGKGPKPQFDRWTYWEKFDYFAVFWGVAIIGASGLIMWFPEVLHPLPAGLDHQHRAHHPLGRGAAGRRLHLLDPFLQHAFPHREIPDGHRHLLRPRLQDRDAARAQALV